MTIKEHILQLLENGESLHYLVISKRIKKNPTSVIVMLKQLREDGLVETPTFSIVKTKRGFYQLKKGKE